MKGRSPLAAIALTLVSLSAFGSSYEDLEQVGERFDALQSELLMLQEQLLPRTVEPPSRSSVAYEYLNSCSNVLSSANTKLTFTVRLLKVSQLVWDPTARKLARPHIDIQTRLLVQELDRSAEFVEKLLPNVGNQGVGRLCLKTRDLLRNAIPIATQLQPSWPERN